jgi:2-dehydropantoate 2-reductase
VKIAISGIGGVGGYFGGLLAKQFQNSSDVEIFFIAKGENEKAIQQNGLQLFTSKGNYIINPKLTTSDTKLIGKVDLIICCTKSYDLKENMLQCRPCLTSRTIILPLLNGVDSRQRISEIFPSNQICDGVVYIISFLTEPGIVKETGNIRKLFFGSNNKFDERLEKILEIFKHAGIEATLSDNIEQVIWEKFVFISTIATLTSYLDDCIGNILSDSNKKSLLNSLLSEIKLIAGKKNISLPENIIQLTLNKMMELPFETTSSMHRDFKKGKNTEVDSLTGYVVNAGKKLNTPVPTFEMMYKTLKNKNLLN